MQPTLKDWLDRKPKGKAPRKRIPAMSAKRKKQLAEYRKRRAYFVKTRTFCQGRDDCFNSPTDIHHRAGRVGEKLLDEKDWVIVCRDCHNWIHAHPSEARELGLLAGFHSGGHGDDSMTTLQLNDKSA